MLHSTEKEIIHLSEVLRKGGVILYPTDTIWGLGCDATNQEAITRIFQIKKRSPSKSMIILVDSTAMIEKYADNPSPYLLKYMEHASAPTTGIFSHAKNLPDNLINADGSLGIRIASDVFCKSLIHHFKKPIVSTSANISNKPSPANFSEIDSVLIDQVDYTAQYSRNDLSKKAPSSIVRINDKGILEKLR